MSRLPSSLQNFVQRRSTFEPAYLETYRNGRLAEKVEMARAELRRCRVCPRDCDVDRLQDQRAVCRTGRWAQVASVGPHFGEEDCLRGWNGSGTIFFSYCNLRCVFCQNFDISWEGNGREMTADEIAALMLELQEQGCHNINFVTPEHVAPQVLEAIYQAIGAGLRIPIVYNTSSYDSMRSLELLDGVVDIYMPDLKIWSEETSRRLLLTADYREHACRAIAAMHDQVGDLVVDEEGLALRGLLVRHLVMPDRQAGTRQIMRFLAQQISPHTYVNIMDQYRPAGLVSRRPERYASIGRPVEPSEIVQARQWAEAEGLYRFDTHWRRSRSYPAFVV